MEYKSLKIRKLWWSDHGWLRGNHTLGIFWINLLLVFHLAFLLNTHLIIMLTAFEITSKMYKGERPKDTTWEHFHLLEESNKKMTQCKSCLHTQSIRAVRVKDHYMWIKFIMNKWDIGLYLGGIKFDIGVFTVFDVFYRQKPVKTCFYKFLTGVTTKTGFWRQKSNPGVGFMANKNVDNERLVIRDIEGDF